MTTSKPLDFEWESPEKGDGFETSGNSVRLRRGDISDMVTRERNRMLDTTLTKSDANDGSQSRSSRGSPFKALAESYGFRVITEEDANECQPEYDSEGELSEDESITTTNYSCFSDHESEDQSEQRTFIQGPFASISDISIHQSTRPYPGANNPPPPQGLYACVGKDGNRRVSQTVTFAREKSDPVVDDLGTPRDPSVPQRGYPDTTPIHFQSTAIQRSLGSAFKPVLARTRVGYKTPENSKSPVTTYKVFSEKPGGNAKLQFPILTPKTLWTRETNEYSSNNSTIIVSKQARPKNSYSETLVDPPKDKQHVKKDDQNKDRSRDHEDASSLPEEQRSKNEEFVGMERKPCGGMIYRLRDSKLAGNIKKTGHTAQVTDKKVRRKDTRERCIDSSSSSTSKVRRDPQLADSIFLNMDPNSGQTAISHKPDSIAAVGEYGGHTKSPLRKRDMKTTVNLGNSEGDVRHQSSLKELATSVPSLQPFAENLTDCNSSADKPHEDYKRNINSNYEDVDDSEEISASSFIGQYLYELWKNQCLCDVRIRVGKNSYMAHKIVLAAFSDVFCPNEPRKMPSLCFDIPNSTPDAVYQILLYLYTSEMELTDGILEEVLNAATFMGIWEVICLIKEILSKPTFENFVRYQEIRERQGMSTSLLNFPEIVREHLLELLNSPYFLQLSVEEMEALLKDPDILVESEADVMQVIIKWIECDPNRRIKSASKLLCLVNFDCLPTEELFNIVDEKKHLFDMDAIQVFMEAFRNLALKQSDPKCDGQFNAPMQDRERCQQPTFPKQGQQPPTTTCQAKFCNDQKAAKSFKEIRDQFASQRQIEARHMLQRNTPNFTVEKVPRDQTCLSQTKRKLLDRVPRCDGGEDKQTYDIMPRGPNMHQKPATDNWSMRTTCKLNDRKQLKTSPPVEEQFCGQKPRQVNFDACGWDEPECLCKSNKCSSAGGWSTVKGEQEDDTENEAEVQPGRRAVRRRGDIIRSCSSPCDTSGSEKCARKRVTFC